MTSWVPVAVVLLGKEGIVKLEHYPLQHFPRVMQDAIGEVYQKTQAPYALIAASALAAAALACQHGRLVRRPKTSPCPLSLSLASVADSGERKTTCDRMFFRFIKTFEKEQLVEHATAMKKARAEQEAWSLRYKEVQKVLRKSSCNESALAELEALQASEPVIPKRPQLLYNDITPEALIYALYQNWPSACLQFDEGARLLDSRVGRELYLLNSLWDGSPQTVERKTGPSFQVEDASLSISLMIQPVAFRRFLKKRGAEAQESGFLARFLVAMPLSTQGFRMEDTYLPLPSCELEAQSPALNKFGDILVGLLRDSMSLSRSAEGGSAQQILTFSEGARSTWRNFNNEIENHLMRTHQDLGPRAAYAKLGEQVARIAGIFHCIEQCDGLEISDYILQRAIELGSWYLRGYERILGGSGEFTVRGDAERLCNFLFEYAKRNYSSSHELNSIPVGQIFNNDFQNGYSQGKLGRDVPFSLAFLYQRAPSGLRKKDRLRPAIEYASDRGWLRRERKPDQIVFLYHGPRAPQPWNPSLNQCIALAPAVEYSAYQI